MQRDTAACTARKLEMNPMTNMASSGLVTPAPRWVVNVSDTTSPDWAATTSSRFGMARISAALENITTRPTRSRPKMIALGTLRSGSSTSSAIEPAASKPRKDHPTKATASSMGPDVHVAASGMPALENSAENGFSR